MKGQATVPVLNTSGWIDHAASRLIRHAARSGPGALAERLEEEWLAANSEQEGPLRRLAFAVGCCWAAAVIAHDYVSAPETALSPAEISAVPVIAYRSVPPLFSRRNTRIVDRNDLCEINTTPLIDVMLVLLVTLIVTLPLMTHAVKLDLPQTPSLETPRPEVIDLDVDFDGTVVWNGRPLGGMDQLERYFRVAAARLPQPEVHLRADRRAKYDVVARVLASAQRNRMKKVGFTDTAEFKD